jgi:hypothetical protein
MARRSRQQAAHRGVRRVASGGGTRRDPGGGKAEKSDIFEGRIVRTTKQMLVLGLLCLSAGCGYIDGDPATWRQQCRNQYTIEVVGEPEDIHKALVTGMFSYGWGEGGCIHQDFTAKDETGSVWAYCEDPRSTTGFIIDVAPAASGRTSITVYPESRYFARRSREWLEKTLKLPAKEGT